MPKIQIPEDAICPITQEIMTDPAATSAGSVYEYQAISDWLKHKNTDPKTNAVLESKTVIRLPAVKNMINDFLSLIQKISCSQEQFFAYIAANEYGSLQNINYSESYLVSKINVEAGGLIPLIYAAKHNAYRAIEWLLKEGVDIEQAFDNGSTALSVAAQAHAVESVQVLLQRGANVNVLSHGNNDNYSPLFWTLNCQQPANSNHQIKVIELLAKAGANLEHKIAQSGNNTALHLSASLGRHDLVAILLQHGANRKAVNSDGKLPEQMAREQGHIKLANFLVKYGTKQKLQAQAMKIETLEKQVQQFKRALSIK